MSIIVQKFGGTSVGDVERIKAVAKKVARVYRQGHQVVVVVSAMGHATDHLLELSKQLHPNPPKREISQLLATGEQISMALLAMALDKLQVPALSFTGAQAGIYTEKGPTEAQIEEIKPTRIRGALAKGQVAVVAGFQGQNKWGDTTTLGRGGSDTTAVALAAALKADLCEIFTDVDGVYTVDPRLVRQARKLDTVCYDEMLELAIQGAQVLHPRAVELAMEYGIDLHVRSSFTEAAGTIIMEESKMEKGTVVRGIACDRNQTKMAILDVPDKPGMAAKIFKALADTHINIDLIVQSVHKNGTNDILFTVSQDDGPRAHQILEPICGEIGAGGVISQAEVAKISVVGIGMTDRPGVAATMFQALAAKGINIEIISTSEIRISCLIAAERLEEAAASIHEAFNMGKKDAPCDAASD
jgi:aspartate kinase